MTRTISMAYGTQTINVNYKSDTVIYSAKEPMARINAADFEGRLNDFLPKAALDLSNPAVVVADKTRLCGYPQFLPVLLETMIQHGADPKAITLYIAYGTHMRQSDEASLKAYGLPFTQYRWVHHDCEDDHFVRVGTTRRGMPVHLRRDIAGASCVITFGAVSHHYFAGYGGGRKLIFPGLGKKEDIYANHGLFLDRPGCQLAPGCRPGRLEGNPLAEDLAERESFRPADMAIHGIIDGTGRICDLLVGQGRSHFRRACDHHAAQSEVVTDRHYNLVVAGCGGYPKDINFIQSHKAIHHGADFVRDGGRLIVLAECRDSIGSHTFLPWFELGSWDIAFGQLAEQYEGNGGTALAMMAKSKRIRISLVTELNPVLSDLIGFERISPAQAQSYIDQHDGSLAIIPNASMVVRSPYS